MGQKKGGRGRGSGRRHFVTSADDLEKRNENQERYKATRAARRQDGEGSGSESDEASEAGAEELAAQMEAMRAGAAGGGDAEGAKAKKKGAAGAILTANPNASGGAHTKHLKAGRAGEGGATAAPLTRREREEIERQRSAAAYAKRHAEGKTDEFKGDMERLKAAKARREAEAAAAKKDDADAARQKALAAAAADMALSPQLREKVAEAEALGSFFEEAGGGEEDVPKLEPRKVKAMKPALLKEELKLRGLSTQGNAKALVARLLETCKV